MKKINKSKILVLVFSVIAIILIIYIVKPKPDNVHPGIYISGPIQTNYYKKTTYTVKVKSSKDAKNVDIALFSSNFPPINDKISNLKANKTFSKNYTVIFYGNLKTNKAHINVAANFKSNSGYENIGTDQLAVKLIYSHKYKPIPYPIVTTNN